MANNQQQIQIQLQETSVSPAGEFEIIAITAGMGNGYDFPARVLEESLGLWDAVSCFVDHSYTSPHSVKDLAGVLYEPAWDQSAQGIRLKLKAMGPAADLLAALGKAVLKESKRPDVGFSADILFQINESDARPIKVDKILKVFSVDLVFDPARGGEFIRQLYQSTIANQQSAIQNQQSEIRNQQSRSVPMGDQTPTPTSPAQQELDELNKIKNHTTALISTPPLREGQGVGPAAVEDELNAMRQVRLQACGLLLETALDSARLPAALTDSIRSQFANKLFDPEGLTRAIEDGRKLVSELTGSSTVQGPNRVHSVFDTRDQLQAAVDDLLEAPRDTSSANLKVQRLAGIRELYMMLTGDYDLHGGYRADRVKLATTADFSGLVKNALNKLIISDWQKLGEAGYDWWKQIVTVQHFGSVNDITGVIVGTVGDLPTVAEGAEYTELAVGDSPETASFVKYGGYIPLTLELIDRDETHKVRAYAREMASAGLRKVSKLVAAIFTSNSAVGPTLADTGALFNATAVTTKGGHKNLLTTALASAEWEVVSAAVYNQPMLIKQDTGYYGTGPKMALNPRYCLVPRALQLTANEMFFGTMVKLATYNYDNMQKGQAVPVVVPEWTDATDWAAVCDPAIAPSIFVGERFGLLPEVFIAGDEQSPAVFTNDETRLKVRHFLAVWVNDFRPLHKSNVGG